MVAYTCREERMLNPEDDAVAGWLVAIIADGFNRSLGALEAAGAVNTKQLRAQYTGVGSKYYDVVTEQIVLTARYAAPHLRRLVLEGLTEPD
jgi:hypothetical protein